MWNMFNINKLYFCKKYMRRCKKEAKTFLKYRKYPIKRLQVLWLSTLIFLWFWIPVSWFLLVLCYTAMREKCPDMELFLVRIFLYSNWNNTVFGHFSRSESYNFWLKLFTKFLHNNKFFQEFEEYLFLNCCF